MYHSDMSEIPEAVEGYVAYEQPDEPVLKDPGEAEALAMNLLSAASEARAHRLADQDDVVDVDQEASGDDQADDPGDADPQVERVETVEREAAFGTTD